MVVDFSLWSANFDSPDNIRLDGIRFFGLFYLMFLVKTAVKNCLYPSCVAKVAVENVFLGFDFRQPGVMIGPGKNQPDRAMKKVNRPEDLVVRVVSGDELAWQQLVEKYYGFLFALASRYSRGDDDLAEELCVFALENLRKSGTDGVTFARLRHYLASMERFGGRSRFSTWLALVARNIFRDWFRARVGRSKKLAEDGEDPHQNELLRRWPTAYSVGRCQLEDDRLADASVRSRPDEMLERREDLQLAARLGLALRGAVERLPEKTRQVLLLHSVRGLPGEPIGRIMGFDSRQKVYDELARARRALRRDIERLGFSPQEISAAIEHLADVFSEGFFPDPGGGSVLNGQQEKERTKKS